MAAIAAGVIEHAQLAAEAARHRAAVEHLLRASSELTRSSSRKEMLSVVCEGIRDALGFEKAAVFLDEADDGWLALVGRRRLRGPRRHRPVPGRRDSS